MKFALFSGSAPEWAPVELGRRLAAQGWDGVEWRVVDQKPAAEPGFWAGNRATFPLTGLASLAKDVRAATEGAGLESAGLAGYAAVADHDQIDALFSAMVAIGARRTRVTVPKVPPDARYNEIFERTQRDLLIVSQKARRYGVQGLVQIHHGNVVSTASAARRILDGIDPQTISVIHDLGNMTVEGREGLNTYTPGMEILGPYLAHVHVKNVVWKPGPPQTDGTIDWAWSWAPLATGLGNVKSYMRSLKEIGYDGWVTLENFTTDLPTEQRLSGDLRYIRAAAMEAGYGLKPLAARAV